MYLTGGSVVKNPPAMQETQGTHMFDSWVGKILWRRKWQPIQYSCLGNPHPQGCKVSDKPEQERLKDGIEWNNIYERVLLIM